MRILLISSFGHLFASFLSKDGLANDIEDSFASVAADAGRNWTLAYLDKAELVGDVFKTYCSRSIPGSVSLHASPGHLEAFWTVLAHSPSELLARSAFWVQEWGPLPFCQVCTVSMRRCIDESQSATLDPTLWEDPTELIEIEKKLKSLYLSRLDIVSTLNNAARSANRLSILHSHLKKTMTAPPLAFGGTREGIEASANQITRAILGTPTTELAIAEIDIARRDVHFLTAWNILLRNWKANVTRMREGLRRINLEIQRNQVLRDSIIL